MTSIIPSKGCIIKMPAGCGVILDVYQNDTGEVLLKILFAKHVTKLQDPELMPLSLANELGLVLSNEADLLADLDENRRYYEMQFEKRFNLLESTLASIRDNRLPKT
jgi:hypothetical protein